MSVEASRVKKFQSVCEDNSIDNNIGKLIELGNLMNESHTSCRDLYDCSHPQLDRLVELAQHGPGCYGARLTGAG